MCRFEPPQNFKFPVAQNLVNEFKEQVDEQIWEERLIAVAALKKKMNFKP